MRIIGSLSYGKVYIVSAEDLVLTETIEASVVKY